MVNRPRGDISYQVPGFLLFIKLRWEYAYSIVYIVAIGRVDMKDVCVFMTSRDWKSCKTHSQAHICRNISR